MRIINIEVFYEGKKRKTLVARGEIGSGFFFKTGEIFLNKLFFQDG